MYQNQAYNTLSMSYLAFFEHHFISFHFTRKGDIIEAIDGNKITDPSQMSSHIRKRIINEKIIITINRYGRRYDCQVQLLARY